MLEERLKEIEANLAAQMEGDGRLESALALSRELLEELKNTRLKNQATNCGQYGHTHSCVEVDALNSDIEDLRAACEKALAELTAESPDGTWQGTVTCLRTVLENTVIENRD